MPALKYWDIPSGGFTGVSGAQGPQGVIGSPGPQGPAGATMTPGTWTAMSYNATWSTYGSGYRAGMYMKDSSGWVYLTGVLLCSATVASNVSYATFITTLPSGYRPANNELFLTNCGGWTNSGGPARINVNPDGTIQYVNTTPASATNPWVSLSGIWFIADGS
jgi:hypothetical protein